MSEQTEWPEARHRGGRTSPCTTIPRRQTGIAVDMGISGEGSHALRGPSPMQASRMSRRARAKGPLAVLFALCGLGGLGAWIERSGWAYVWFPGLLPPPLTSDGTTIVSRVRDGDTIEIRYHDLRLAVRLRNVDTAESVHQDQGQNTAFGAQAADYARARLEGATVRIVFADRRGLIETDQYGRALADIWLGEEFFNETLIRQGWSRYETGYGVHERHHARLLAAEASARSEGLGLWRSR